MTIPVAGASIGSTLRFGTAKVVTASATVAPQGWDSGRVSFQHSVYFTGQTGAAAWLAFEGEYSPPTPYNVAFTFGGYLNTSGVSAGNQSKFGSPRVGNKARQLLPKPIQPAGIGKPLVYDAALSGVENFKFEIPSIYDEGTLAPPVEGQYVFEELTGWAGTNTDYLYGVTEYSGFRAGLPYTAPSPKNVPFNFGDGQVISGVTVGNQLRIGGVLHVKKPLQGLPFGIDATAKFGAARVGFFGPVILAFDEPYAPAPTTNLPFIFGDGVVVGGAGGFQTLKWGLGTTVANKAKTVAPKGFNALAMGRGTVSDTTSNGVGVDFAFLQDYVPTTPLNAPFYFEWIGRIQADKPEDHSVFGTAEAWLFHHFVTETGGIDSAEFGTTTVENWAEFAFKPQGIPPPILGEPTVAIAPRYFADIVITLDPPLGEFTVTYDSAVSRPHVNNTHNRHQSALHLNDGTVAQHQVSNHHDIGALHLQKNSQRNHKGIFVDLTNQFLHINQRKLHQQQNGAKVRPTLNDAFQGGDRSGRKYIHTLNQKPQVLRYDPLVVWTNMLRDRRGYIGVKNQDGKNYELGRYQTFDVARPVELGWEALFQNAVVPQPGTAPKVIPPPEKICYTPSPHLVFKNLGVAGTPQLIFVCEGDLRPKPPDPNQVVVPVRKVYITMNEVRVFKLSPLGTRTHELNPLSLTLKIDMDSWSWGFTLSLPSQDESKVYLAHPGAPMEFEAVVNGESYILVGEQVSRTRSFGKMGISLSGRGHSCYLAAPFVQGINFSNPDDSTAQQLMANALTTNGVSIGWQVDWNIADWFVPAGVWSASGSYMDAVGSIMKSAGAFVYSHPNEKRIAINPRYPVLPWAWAGTTPDIILPTDVVDSESVAWESLPEYNGVYVSGVSKGVLALVKRTGSAGDVMAPMMTDALITDAIAARMAGGNILSQTGKVATIGLSLPVLPETGIIKPGKMIQYSEGASSVMGLVKGVSVSMTSQTNLRQNIEVEVHG